MKSNKYVMIEGRTGAVRDITMTDTYNELHEKINCECFGVDARRIGRKTFDIWHDDEFLYTCGPGQIVAKCLNYDEVLMGNIIVARHDSEGNTVGLTDEEIANVKDAIIYRDGRGYLMYKV